MKQENILTLKGSILADTVERLILFDGRFDTAFKILSFDIVPSDVDSNQIASAKLMTEDDTHTATWNWQKNTEVGWSTWGRNTHVVGGYSRVDKEALIVQDLFIDCTAVDGKSINYIIELHKVNITSWKGALAMVRNKSQGAD